jgi:hypothetical protein
MEISFFGKGPAYVNLTVSGAAKKQSDLPSGGSGDVGAKRQEFPRFATEFPKRGNLAERKVPRRSFASFLREEKKIFVTCHTKVKYLLLIFHLIRFCFAQPPSPRRGKQG